MNDIEDKELWDLLGKAESRQAGPMFTQNVLRAIRLEEAAREERKGFWASLLSPLVSGKKWVPATVLGLIAVVCGSLVFLNPQDTHSGNNLADINMESIYSQELADLEQTALALGSENTDVSILEMASCYSDSFTEDEIQYLMAYL